MHSRIMEGLRKGEFHLAYQPQLSADGQNIVAVEALVRWSPARDSVLLSVFLEAAEHSGAIVDIGNYVLRRACTDALKWPSIKVAVNVSVVQLRDERFADTVENIVRETGLPFERLELEIVESSLIDNFEQVELTLSRLRKLGITIALDDFGTGYSSLTYLTKLKFDKLKIDKSFIEHVDTVQSASIVQAVVALARAIGLKITAEGVETETQRKFLKACGVHYVQGFLFAKPMSEAAFTQLLQHRNVA